MTIDRAETVLGGVLAGRCHHGLVPPHAAPSVAAATHR